MSKLSPIIKRELREYFQIKNITISRKKEKVENIEEYYSILEKRKNEIETLKEVEKQKNETEKLKNEKRRLRNIKKRNRRKNKQMNEKNDSDDSDDSDNSENDEENFILTKPYISFLEGINFYKNLHLIKMLNNYYYTNDKYREYLKENNFTKIKVIKSLHYGYTDELHFNVCFYNSDESIKSNCVHVYVDDKIDNIIKLSLILYLGI